MAPDDSATPVSHVRLPHGGVATLPVSFVSTNAITSEPSAVGPPSVNSGVVPVATPSAGPMNRSSAPVLPVSASGASLSSNAGGSAAAGRPHGRATDDEGLGYGARFSNAPVARVNFQDLQKQLHAKKRARHASQPTLISPPGTVPPPEQSPPRATLSAPSGTQSHLGVDGVPLGAAAADAPLGNNPRISEILASKQYLAAFKRFCENEHSEENICFWLAVEAYRLSVPRTKAAALEVYNRFLNQSSQYALPLSTERAEQTLAVIQAVSDHEQPPADLFADQQVAVVGIMRSDIYVRFLQSDSFRLLRQGHGRPASDSNAGKPCCIIS